MTPRFTGAEALAGGNSMKACLLLIPVLFVLGCGEGKTPQTAGGGGSHPLSAFVLPADPGAGVGVEAAKAAAPNGEAMVVGRVSDVVKGLAAFQLTDPGLDYCGYGADTMDDCDTPWDYCCTSSDEVRAKTLLVELRGKDGQPIEAESLPDLRLLDLVVAKGAMVKDENGNVKLLADGFFRRERPQLRDGLSWPR
jgi:hypothetical protein